MTGPANGHTPRVAIVCRDLGDGSVIGRGIFDHARYLHELGYIVDLIGETLPANRCTPAGGQAITIAPVPVLKRYAWRWFAARVERVLAADRYHFVVGHGYHYRQHVLVMHACLRMHREYEQGKPPSARVRLAELHDHIFARSYFRYCICHSRLMRDDFARRYGVDRARLPVIYPGYRPEQFDRTQRPRYRENARAELNCGDKVLIGLIVREDNAGRGLARLLEAYAGLDAGKRRRTLLLAVGAHASGRVWRRYAQKLGIGADLRWVGPTCEPQRYMHALDVCVHPADIDTFGQSVQEAIVCGVPVVTSRRVGAAELLPPSMFQALPKTSGVESLRAQLEALIDTPALRADIAALAYQGVRDNTQKKSMALSLDIYRDAGL